MKTNGGFMKPDLIFIVLFTLIGIYGVYIYSKKEREKKKKVDQITEEITIQLNKFNARLDNQSQRVKDIAGELDSYKKMMIKSTGDMDYNAKKIKEMEDQIKHIVSIQKTLQENYNKGLKISLELPKGNIPVDIKSMPKRTVRKKKVVKKKATRKKR